MTINSHGFSRSMQLYAHFHQHYRIALVCRAITFWFPIDPQDYRLLLILLSSLIRDVLWKMTNVSLNGGWLHWCRSLSEQRTWGGRESGCRVQKVEPTGGFSYWLDMSHLRPPSTVCDVSLTIVHEGRMLVALYALGSCVIDSADRRCVNCMQLYNYRGHAW